MASVVLCNRHDDDDDVGSNINVTDLFGFNEISDGMKKGCSQFMGRYSVFVNGTK